MNDVTDCSPVSYKLSSSSRFCWSIQRRQSLIYLYSALSLTSLRSPYFNRYISIVSDKLEIYSFISSIVSSRLLIIFSEFLHFSSKLSIYILFSPTIFLKFYIVVSFVEIRFSICKSFYCRY